MLQNQTQAQTNFHLSYMQRHNIKAGIYALSFLIAYGYSVGLAFLHIQEHKTTILHPKKIRKTMKHLKRLVMELVFGALVTEMIWLSNKNSIRMNDLEAKFAEQSE